MVASPAGTIVHSCSNWMCTHASMVLDTVQEDMSTIAGAFGIENFEVMLRRAQRQEKDEADGRAAKPKYGNEPMHAIVS